MFVSSGKWIVSLALAFIVGQGLFPTPNVVGGGEASMVILIFLTVAIKATLDFMTRRWKKKSGGPQKPSD